ncbi:protein of unknown function (plasmid) [Paraburkholderia dioscoreae]|uniref:Uncharacterized protein n=1 Tax=Paraburkholderia dioscoreae TaxID=2604047 RepID=A0A5Q4ZH90_9BURK|nr:protein of unknown function [Paraburkholderia dioscoreae]
MVDPSNRSVWLVHIKITARTDRHSPRMDTSFLAGRDGRANAITGLNVMYALVAHQMGAGEAMRVHKCSLVSASARTLDLDDGNTPADDSRDCAHTYRIQSLRLGKGKACTVPFRAAAAGQFDREPRRCQELRDGRTCTVYSRAISLRRFCPIPQPLKPRPIGDELADVTSSPPRDAGSTGQDQTGYIPCRFACRAKIDRVNLHMLAIGIAIDALMSPLIQEIRAYLLGGDFSMLLIVGDSFVTFYRREIVTHQFASKSAHWCPTDKTPHPGFRRVNPMPQAGWKPTICSCGIGIVRGPVPQISAAPASAEVAAGR